MNVKVRGLIRLTRWSEYLTWVVPLSAFGSILALRATGGLPDWRLPLAIVANFLVVAYAFMINDIVDAPDDAREEHRKARNPVSCGEISPAEGWIASLLVAGITLGAFALLGQAAFITGAVTLVISHLYSWKPIRLKALPVLDVISHVLMLSTLLFVAGYVSYDPNILSVWPVVLAMTLVSVYGQLYNQLRDYEMDKAAKLNNTSIVIGAGASKILMYAALVGAGAALIYAVVAGIIPLWVVAVPILLSPLLVLMRNGADSRGTKAVDISGSVQNRVLVIANVTVAVWIIALFLRLG
jgi:4-hydroxybenzoate polyprenyltransferase